MKNTLMVSLFSLFVMMACQVYADPPIGDSTSSQADVIAGDTSMFGGGKGKRIISGNLKSMYNGAVSADGSRVRWPYFCYTNNPYCPALLKCNISSGSCSTHNLGTHSHSLTPGGVITHHEVQSFPNTKPGYTTFSPWVK